MSEDKNIAVPTAEEVIATEETVDTVETAEEAVEETVEDDKIVTGE